MALCQEGIQLQQKAKSSAFVSETLNVRFLTIEKGSNASLSFICCVPFDFYIRFRFPLAISSQFLMVGQSAILFLSMKFCPAGVVNHSRKALFTKLTPLG